MSRLRHVASLVAACLAAAVFALACATAGRADASPRSPIPVLAYYYIWFTPGSWDRAKTDYPLLGRYSSDDIAVMRRHVELAKKAGITGFIVSWKSTPRLNRRLANLVRIADAHDFKLAVIYQGLDFEREPLPVARIENDLEYFADRFASDRAFGLFEKPLVIWSGTWEFAPADIARVTRAVQRRLLVVASERNVESYAKIAASVHGNAYYWSSVDPDTDRGYAEKLAAMGAAVHAQGGLWIAPAAPGFDARMLGGRRVIARQDGELLRREMDTAIASSPDAVGLISWNEFSENSHVEPSDRYGKRYLEVLADILGTKFTFDGDFDSSEAPTSNLGYGVPLFAGFGFIVFTALVVGVWRREIRNAAGKSL